MNRKTMELVIDALKDLKIHPDQEGELYGMTDTIYNLVKRNDKQYKELQKAIKDRDYWKAEAIKHCAKLGEIKLLIGRSNG